jgi:hypothetical protein
MNWHSWARLGAAVFSISAAVIGCKPSIGDDCTVSSDCSVTGDRLCDTTQPGGYCTVFNCEPGLCPKESICVGYGNVPSAAKSCSDQQGGQRLQRTFCLRRCDSDSDCRTGYKCKDMGRKNPWGAVVVEHSGTNGKVCAVEFRGLEPETGAAICTGSWSGDGGSGRDGAAGDGSSDTGTDAADGGSDAGNDSAAGDAGSDALSD